jgi:hypothetical protein
MEDTPYHKRTFHPCYFEDGTSGLEQIQWVKRHKHDRVRIVSRIVDDDAPQKRIPSLTRVHLLKSAFVRREFLDAVSAHREKTPDFMQLLCGMLRGLKGEKPGDVVLQWRLYKTYMPPEFIQTVEDVVKKQPPKYLSEHRQVRSDWYVYDDHNKYPMYY